MKKLKLLKKVLGSAENTRFQDLCTLVEAFGFRLSRITGSHHIYVHPQIRQFLALIEENDLDMEAGR